MSLFPKIALFYRKFNKNKKQEVETVPQSRKNLSDKELIEVKKNARRVMAEIRSQQFKTAK